jgi:hypothetical protein
VEGQAEYAPGRDIAARYRLAGFWCPWRSGFMCMKFTHGISPEGLARWEAFERIRSVQVQRGPEVGASALRFIVDAELSAIARATAAEDRRRAPCLPESG